MLPADIVSLLPMKSLLKPNKRITAANKAGGAAAVLGINRDFHEMTAETLGSNLTAFLGADLTGFAAGFAYGNLGKLLAFRLAVLADHLDHLGKMAGML